MSATVPDEELMVCRLLLCRVLLPGCVEMPSGVRAYEGLRDVSKGTELQLNIGVITSSAGAGRRSSAQEV
jgi:hypothetical protein